MREKFQNKYRIPSARLPNWDYRSESAYFITISTAKGEHYFGAIEDEQMVYSPIGAIADVLWYEIKNHTRNVELGAFVIMPNHVHGILILNSGANVSSAPETMHAAFARNAQMSAIAPKSNSISTIIRGYKSAVTKHANRLKLNFGWHSRFYDHVIRDAKAYDNIHNYIMNNPANWHQDKFYDTGIRKK